MVACARLGLRAKYIGAVGDDERGRIQMESLRGTGINLDHVQLRRDCPNQSAYIIIDRSTGERTVLWRRDDCLRIDPEQIAPEQIACARLLHIDGHDTPAVARAAAIARQPRHSRHGGRRHHLPRLRPRAAERRLPGGQLRISHAPGPASSDPFRALETMQNEYGMKVAAMTLGAHGALARASGEFFYSPGFRGELRGYHRRGRRVSRGVLLCCFAGNADARRAGIFQRHGGAELHRAGRARRHSRRGGESAP